MITKLAARSNGRPWYACRVENQRSTAATPICPAVTIPQNAFNAIAATVVEAPSLRVMSSWDQLR
jgi:hypothetical protein